MHVVKGYPNGVFCWVDLATTDVNAAKAFYSGLFGWEYDDVPTDVGTVYSMCQIDGKNVAGLSTLTPEMQDQGIPPFWSSYVKHDDVDAVAAKVTKAGGTLMLPPMDVMESGRMTMATDPTGAAFAVWQPKLHTGAQLVNMPNTLVWNELQTPDSEAAKAFYHAVFGWTYDVDPNGYVSIKSDERTQAGMMQMDESWGDAPPNWSVYFFIEDVSETAENAKALGGKLLVPPTPAGELGTFAVVQDPQGGVFSVMQFDGPVDPPPDA